MLEVGDIQGIIFSGYAAKPFARYLFLRIQDARGARRWLRSIGQDVTSGVDRPPDSCLNVAFTASGLAALGLDQDSLETFPLEFREGMAGSETRSRMLGDVGPSEPTHWLWGGPNTQVHALLMLYARSHEVLEAFLEQQHARFEGALECVYERDTVSLPDRREHFGFADGIAQPAIEGSGQEARSQHKGLKAGEFILGYENEYGKLPFVPNVAPPLDRAAHLEDCRVEGPRKALGRNGSYLVVRQLDQHVQAFWEFARQSARELYGPAHANDAAVLLASKCVGRWPSGAPLVEAPEYDDPSLGNKDDFGYFWKDRHGIRCPAGSHIRRANPRDSLEPDPFNSTKMVNRHRIIRRGRSYGRPVPNPWLVEQDDGEERGLVFMGVNANIRRQFEFIRQTWLNNEKFDGLYDESDPLLGGRDGGKDNFTIPSDGAPRRIQGIPQFVTVRGGDYFFLPGLRALRFLSSLAV